MTETLRSALHRRAGRVSAVIALALSLASACDTVPPTSPSPTPVATAITVTSSSGYLMLGQTESFTATIAFNDGTTRALTGGTWGSDASGVATVGTTTGLVTSLNAGDVTIFVDAQGLRGTRRVTVVPDYQGNWSGIYTVTNCTDTGQMQSYWLVCENLVWDGSPWRIALNLTQTGGTITGHIALDPKYWGPDFTTTFTTTAAADGRLAFEATHQGLIHRIAQDWRLNVQVGQLTGTAVHTWTDPGLSGTLVIAGTLLDMRKSAAQTPLNRRD